MLYWYGHIRAYAIVAVNRTRDPAPAMEEEQQRGLWNPGRLEDAYRDIIDAAGDGVIPNTV